MKWKLWTRDETVSPPVESSKPHDSKEDALKAACELIGPPIRQLHVKVLFIEEPDGRQIGFKEIEAWCNGQDRPA